jgi:metal-responsive CopG/Arc/MetJ family transcriptional regulator
VTHKPKSGSTQYYLNRGFRLVAVAIPTDLLVEFDARVAGQAFQSRSSVVAKALRHFLDCPTSELDISDDAEA